MKLIVDDFADPFLRGYINKNGDLSHGRHVIDSKNPEFLSLFRDFLYALEAHPDGDSLSSIFRDRFHIVKNELNEKRLNLFLDDLNRSVTLSLPLEGHYRFRVFNDAKRVEDLSILRSLTWSEFVDQIKFSNRFHPNGFNKDGFASLIEYISTNVVSKDDSLFRARISERGKQFSVDEIGMPPRGRSTDGRVAAKGIGCLYLSSQKDTAASEIRAGQNDFVTIGTFQPKRDLFLADFRLLKSLSLFDSPDSLEWLIVNYNILIEIASSFEQPQLSTDDTLNYLPTQFIADCVRASGKNDGIAYASTMNDGFNVALFDDNEVRCLKTELFRIRDLSFSLQTI